LLDSPLSLVHFAENIISSFVGGRPSDYLPKKFHQNLHSICAKQKNADIRMKHQDNGTDIGTTKHSKNITAVAAHRLKEP